MGGHSCLAVAVKLVAWCKTAWCKTRSGAVFLS
jgi:hypothetical protein